MALRRCAYNLGMNDPAAAFRPVKAATLLVCLLALLFMVFFDTSKHHPALADNAFTEDPFDAVGSFGVQLALFAALASAVRLARPYPDGVTGDQIALILHGDAVSLLAIAVTLAADWVAMLRDPAAWLRSPAGWALAAVAGGLLLVTALAGATLIRKTRAFGQLAAAYPRGRTAVICLAGLAALAYYPVAWHQSLAGAVLAALLGMACLFILTAAIVKPVFRPLEGQTGGLLGDIAALYQAIKTRAGRLLPLFNRVERMTAAPLPRSAFQHLDPRTHPWRLAFWAALGMGVLLFLAETLGEGAPGRGLLFLVLMVYLGVEGAGVTLAYTLFRQFLGLF